MSNRLIIVIVMLCTFIMGTLVWYSYADVLDCSQAPAAKIIHNHCHLPPLGPSPSLQAMCCATAHAFELCIRLGRMRTYAYAPRQRSCCRIGALSRHFYTPQAQAAAHARTNANTFFCTVILLTLSSRRPPPFHSNQDKGNDTQAHVPN